MPDFVMDGFAMFANRERKNTVFSAEIGFLQRFAHQGRSWCQNAFRQQGFFGSQVLVRKFVLRANRYALCIFIAMNLSTEPRTSSTSPGAGWYRVCRSRYGDRLL